jgi:hypothetical protein
LVERKTSFEGRVVCPPLLLFVAPVPVPAPVPIVVVEATPELPKEDEEEGFFVVSSLFLFLKHHPSQLRIFFFAYNKTYKKAYFFGPIFQ